ncbi:unnamed protein product, partial [Symbiodinium sp. KB8]
QNRPTRTMLRQHPHPKGTASAAVSLPHRLQQWHCRARRLQHVEGGTGITAGSNQELILELPVAKVRRSESSSSSPSSCKSPTSVNVRTFLATVNKNECRTQPAEASETQTQHQKLRAGCTRVIVSV